MNTALINEFERFGRIRLNLDLHSRNEPGQGIPTVLEVSFSPALLDRILEVHTLLRTDVYMEHISTICDGLGSKTGDENCCSTKPCLIVHRDTFQFSVEPLVEDSEECYTQHLSIYEYRSILRNLSQHDAQDG